MEKTEANRTHVEGPGSKSNYSRRPTERKGAGPGKSDDTLWCYIEAGWNLIKNKNGKKGGVEEKKGSCRYFHMSLRLKSEPDHSNGGGNEFKQSRTPNGEPREKGREQNQTPEQPQERK